MRAGATRGLWRLGRARSAEASGREWAKRGAGAKRAEGDRPRAWAELARAATALRPGWSVRCCWARHRGELGRRRLGCGFGLRKRKGKARREGGLGWVFPWAGLFWVWASPRVWASFLFLNYTQTKLNSNSNLNSILALNQIKEMLWHDATTKIKPMINFNYLRNKIRLNAILNTINLRNLNKAN